MPEPTKLKSILSDLELLKTGHVNDVARIASTSSRADIITAIRWIDAGQLPAEAARRVFLADALRKQTKAGEVAS